MFKLQTLNFEEKNTAMKKSVFITFVLLFAGTAICAQQQNEQKEPDEQVIVKKQYDEQGNLIQYDSVYYHKWTTDTTFHFGFPGDARSFGRDFPGIERFMNEFRNDSVFGKGTFPPQPFSFGFRFSPFDDEDFQNRYKPDFPDSLLLFDFPYRFDSLFFNFDFGPSQKLPHQFDEKFFEDFEERLNRHFFRFRDENFAFPGFKNEEHRQEWEELMEKHRRELEELQNKWDNNKSPGKNF